MRGSYLIRWPGGFVFPNRHGSAVITPQSAARVRDSLQLRSARCEWRNAISCRLAKNRLLSASLHRAPAGNHFSRISRLVYRLLHVCAGM